MKTSRTVRIAMWAAYEKRDGNWTGRDLYLLTGKVLARLKVGAAEVFLVVTEKGMYVVRREPRWPAAVRRTDRGREGSYVATVWRTDEKDIARKYPALAEALGLESPIGLRPLDSLGLDVGEGISVDVVSWDEEKEEAEPA